MANMFARRTILLVEDNAADAKLAQKIFEESEINLEVVHVTDGDAALQYLNRCDTDSRLQLPDLVVLDLNLPRRHGREVLKEIKTSERLMHIPVIILTSSESDTEIYESFKCQANAYLKKSVDLFEFMEALNDFKRFWLRSARLPSVTR